MMSDVLYEALERLRSYPPNGCWGNLNYTSEQVNRFDTIIEDAEALLIELDKLPDTPLLTPVLRHSTHIHASKLRDLVHRLSESGVLSSESSDTLVLSLSLHTGTFFICSEDTRPSLLKDLLSDPAMRRRALPIPAADYKALGSDRMFLIVRPDDAPQDGEVDVLSADARQNLGVSRELSKNPSVREASGKS